MMARIPRTGSPWRGLSGTLESFLVSTKPELLSFGKVSAKAFRESQTAAYRLHPVDTSNPVLELVKRGAEVNARNGDPKASWLF